MTNGFEYLYSSPIFEVIQGKNFDASRRNHAGHSYHAFFSVDFEIISNQALASLLIM